MNVIFGNTEPLAETVPKPELVLSTRLQEASAVGSPYEVLVLDHEHVESWYPDQLEPVVSRVTASAADNG